jgi:hypothetical protein
MCQSAWWYISEDSHLHFMFDRQATYLHESEPLGSIRGRTFRGQRVAVDSIMQRKTLLQWSDLTYAQDCLVSTEGWVAVCPVEHRLVVTCYTTLCQLQRSVVLSLMFVWTVRLGGSGYAILAQHGRRWLKKTTKAR